MKARGADVQVTTVPFDSAHRGRRMGAGPTHLVARGLLDRLREAGRRVEVRELVPSDGSWVAEIGTAFDLDRQLAGEVASARARGAFPLTIAGNCISSVGTIAGLGAGTTGVLWFDAHGDFNTPESTVGGFLDGMAMATAVGRCWTALAATVPGFVPVAEQNVVLVGGRDLDPAEAKLLAASAVTHIGAPEVHARLDSALEALAGRVDQLYVHVDLDVLDASEGQANAYAGGPGLSARELLSAIATAGRRCRIGAGAITAYDPEYDVDGRVCATAIEVALALAGPVRHAVPA
ncbi:MAG TPA: arginase family protein [Gemmatimonadaceae bacterium]|nr:arginase family protein [Gemmatimonadaceae bacterium]